MAQLADLEGSVARRLRDLLRSRGIDADLQAKAGPGRARLLVAHDRGKIAIECEVDGPGKKRQAIGNAAGMLAPVKQADAAFAVVCPPKCSEKTLFHDTVLEVSIVDDYVAGARQDCPAPGAGVPGARGGAPARARWSACTVAELADRIRNVHNDMSDPDTIAGRLRDAVDDAAGLLSDDECWDLGSTTGFKQGEGDWRPAARRAARRALLVIASASLLHAWLGPHLRAMRPTTDARTGRRFRGTWNPESLDECHRSRDERESLSEAWSLILAIDYRPIFEMGLAALASLYSESFERAVGIIVNWSRYAADQAGGGRHDILGRVFHTLLDDAPFDGSFYTSVPAATLLAGLAIPRAPARKDLKSLRVLDPACGTGTLLMAAAERLSGASSGDVGRMRLVLNALEGRDINITALKIATTTLGMLSPMTKFDDMNLYLMPLGMVEGTSKVAVGSLELYTHGGLFPFIDWSGARPPRRIDADAGTTEHQYAYSADLVIMNPPYTRNDKRHDQLGEAVEARVKKRESEILAMSPVRLDRTSSGLMFLVLGEYLCSRTGTLACVFPLSSATAPSARGVREFLAKRFDIEYLVASHDPTREYFSENTAISEMLLVMRRKARKDDGSGHTAGAAGAVRARAPTAVILLENPSTAGGAAALAADIAAGRPSPLAAIDTISAESASKGDWGRVLFVSPFLHSAHEDMREGHLFETVMLGDVADIGCGRGVRGCFDSCPTPGKHVRASMYGHDTSKVVSIENRPYSYLVPKKGMADRADRVWAQASHLLFPEKLRLNLSHVTAVCSPDETVGTSWYNVRPRAGGAAGRLRWSKAMAVFLNSTPGIVAVLGMRIPTILSRPRFSSAGAKGMRVPHLSDGQAGALAGAYKRYADKPIGRFAEPDDPVRRGIDEAVSSALGIPGVTVARMRRELAREPMCTGRRYEA